MINLIKNIIKRESFLNNQSNFSKLLKYKKNYKKIHLKQE